MNETGDDEVTNSGVFDYQNATMKQSIHPGQVASLSPLGFTNLWQIQVDQSGSGQPLHHGAAPQ